MCKSCFFTPIVYYVLLLSNVYQRTLQQGCLLIHFSVSGFGEDKAAGPLDVKPRKSLQIIVFNRNYSDKTKERNHVKEVAHCNM